MGSCISPVAWRNKQTRKRIAIYIIYLIENFQLEKVATFRSNLQGYCNDCWILHFTAMLFFWRNNVQLFLELFNSSKRTNFAQICFCLKITVFSLWQEAINSTRFHKSLSRGCVQINNHYCVAVFPNDWTYMLSQSFMFGLKTIIHMTKL